MNLPWSIEEAGAQLRKASRFQQEAEDALRTAYREAAEAEDAYRVRLSEVITELRDMSVPATVCLDLAKGFKDVAQLRRERDIKEGLKAAAEQVCWRRTADRKDAQALSGWSERQMFAEAAGRIEHTFEKPIGTLAR